MIRILLVNEIQLISNVIAVALEDETDFNVDRAGHIGG
jgi:hypothetical protein